ncbi:MAG: class I adenylate-forming enzyme family protein, partial [Burkholderiaceae bacterium]|nr:class I adenylate-forming enzyme family protein [Burkholderiaceae bacterium]
MMLMRDFLRRCGETYAHKAAYIDGDRTYTWAQVQENSAKLASVMLAQGVKKGDTVAILGYDHIEVIEHFFACMQIGALRVGINRGYASREIAHVVRDSDAKLIFIQDNCQQLAAEYLDEFRKEGRTLIGYGPQHTFALDYHKLRDAGDPDFDRPELAGNDPIAISYTSGTTGFPKGVIFKQSGVLDMSVHFVLSVGLRKEDVWLNPTAMA